MGREVTLVVDDTVCLIYLTENLPEVIYKVVTMNVRLPISLQNVEGFFKLCGTQISHEAVRHCRDSFGPLFAAELQKP